MICRIIILVLQNINMLSLANLHCLIFQMIEYTILNKETFLL